MIESKAKYIPALRFDFLTRFYDPLIRWGMAEARFKQELVEQARLAPGQRVLDLGCGTGTLTLLLKGTCPEAVVVGLDGDPRILQVARAKAGTAGVDVTFAHGMAYALPYADSSLDHVFSSLVFHHLTTDDKTATLREIRRVLRPAGQFHLADWGKPHTRAMRAAFLFVQLLDGFATTADNVQGLIPELLRAAGFGEPEHLADYATVFGTLSRFRARKPTS